MTFDSGQKARDAVLVRRFGASVLYTAPGEATREVAAIFEDPTRQSTAGARPVSAKFPMLSVLKSQVPNLRKGDLFDIGDKSYRVKEPATDEGEIVTGKLEIL